MNTIPLYEKLSKVTAQLLESKDLLEEDMRALQETFFDAFHDILRTAFQLNLTEKTLKDFTKSVKGKPSDIELFRFIGELSENPTSYLVINYFLTRFIENFIMFTPRQKHEQILNILEKENLDITFFPQVQNDYQQLILTKKLALRFATA